MTVCYTGDLDAVDEVLAPLDDRLAAVKARYDPDNGFRSNRNVRLAEPERA